MWPMILLMTCLPGGHSMSAGRRPEKLGYGLLLLTGDWLVPTGRSDQRLGRSATGVKGPRYPSPWTTLYVKIRQSKYGTAYWA